MERSPIAFPREAPSRAVVSFAGFTSGDDARLDAWAVFRSSLSGALGAPQPTGGQVRSPAAPRRDSVAGFWRLLATNNRELGRSFLLYARFEQAHTHVKELQADVAGLSIHLVPGPRTGSRGWVVRHRSRPVLSCSRWYESASTGSTSAERALVALVGAELREEPERRTRSGRDTDGGRRG